MSEMKPIIDVVLGQIRTQLDGEIYKAVQDVGIDVDKERLLLALKDAKEYWFEGYRAGRNEPPEWISVEERLPDSQSDVLVVAFWHERWQTMIGWHSDDGKMWRVITPHGERVPGGVTHWMPLPEAPMTEERV